jgi:hypothetical protein
MNPQVSPADLTDKDYRSSLFELEHPLHDAVAWAGMLDEAIERIDRFPSLTRDEMNLACHQLNLVGDALKAAIDRLDATYHQRTKEEAAQ